MIIFYNDGRRKDISRRKLDVVKYLVGIDNDFLINDDLINNALMLVKEHFDVGQRTF